MNWLFLQCLWRAVPFPLSEVNSSIYALVISFSYTQNSPPASLLFFSVKNKQKASPDPSCHSSYHPSSVLPLNILTSLSPPASTKAAAHKVSNEQVSSQSSGLDQSAAFHIVVHSPLLRLFTYLQGQQTTLPSPHPPAPVLAAGYSFTVAFTVSWFSQLFLEWHRENSPASLLCYLCSLAQRALTEPHEFK